MKKTIWITRDGKDGDDPETLFIHICKPINFSKSGRKAEIDWIPGQGVAMAIPIPKHGSKHRVVLEFES